MENDASPLHNVTGWTGTAVSGSFLYVIATINLVVLAGIWKVFRRMPAGQFDEAALEEQLNNRGFMNRLLGAGDEVPHQSVADVPHRSVVHPGFDTATEVALLVLAGSGAASGLPWYAILCLPVLFAAGMSLLDTLGGTFMNSPTAERSPSPSTRSTTTSPLPACRRLSPSSSAPSSSSP
ncbi:hypothetical protein [Streptosporangium nondiastaticum]|uniref:HoxN/HupN/NixA family nickel/cobalt transporter n=1 Tax=Streptosporangium nondiastaticum TaxID=35764 RepID=UPI00256FC24D|nr:hypothetical protein [Streptosporangium nondiastaticum]